MGVHFVVGKLYANSLLTTLNTRKQIRHISTSRSKRGNAAPGVIHRIFGKRKGVPVFPSFGRSVTEPGVTTGNISAGVLRTMEFKRETFQSPISSTASPETATTTTETTSTSTGGLKLNLTGTETGTNFDLEQQKEEDLILEVAEPDPEETPKRPTHLTWQKN